MLFVCHHAVYILRHANLDVVVLANRALVALETRVAMFNAWLARSIVEICASLACLAKAQASIYKHFPGFAREAKSG